MSIRPVDYQILMPKVNEVAKNQNADHQKAMGLIQQQAESASNKAAHDTKTVHSQKESQQAVITDEQKRRNNKQNKRDEQDDKNKKQETSDKAKPKLKERRTIDIRI